MESLRVPVPPPLLFFIALLAGVGLDHVQPWPVLPNAWGFRLGLAGFLFLEGLILGGWALLTLRRRGTPPEFGQNVLVLVQEGPYRFTRNPLYVALVLLLAGFSLGLDSGWVGLGVPLMVLGLDRLVIAREEAFLQVRFGADYQGYLARTRRWL